MHKVRQWYPSADQDPAQWLPPQAGVHCRHVGEGVATKLRRKLTADEAELAALRAQAGDCPLQDVAYEPAL
ncbi:hypothetical protein [Streptomyces sp. NPDC004830]